MKKLEKFDYLAKPIVLFVLRVLGAFGACWGVFSSVDVTRRQFFSYSGEDVLMNNPTYARSAIIISISVATLSGYVLLRESCSKKTDIDDLKEDSTETADTKVEEVRINILTTSDILLTQKKKSSEVKNSLNPVISDQRKWIPGNGSL